VHIAYDATALPPRPVGAGNYIIHLLRALVQQPTGAHFSVFAQPYQRALFDLPANAPVDFIPVPAMPPVLRLLWEQTAFPLRLARLAPDLLHSPHYTLPVFYPGRKVVTLHDLTFFLFPHLHTLPKRYFFRFFTRLSARHAAALLADSESTRQDAIRLAGVRAEKIFTAPLGVTAEFRPLSDAAERERVRQKYALPPQFILFVGLLEPRKNLPLLLRAFAQVKDDLPGQQLVIVGRKGWMFEQAFQLVDALGLAERVVFAGYVERADLPLVYNLADVFVYPSLYEGFGLPVLEALACGTPTITSDISSMPEIVGQAGCLVPSGDEAALAAALRNLLGDRDLRQHLAEAGPRRAAAFTWENTAAQTLAVYRKTINGVL
jgi:glycosyltransferase involved in cell wall biosynthesis